MLFPSCQQLYLKVYSGLVPALLIGNLQLTFLTWAAQPSDLAV